MTLRLDALKAQIQASQLQPASEAGQPKYPRPMPVLSDNTSPEARTDNQGEDWNTSCFHNDDLFNPK